MSETIRPGASDPLLLAGHSHLYALFHGREAATRRVELVDGKWPRTPTYWDEVVDRAAGADLALVFGGNEHNACYFFQGDHAFDFVSRQVNRLLPSIQLLPKKTIRAEFMTAGLSELPAILKRLIDRNPRQLVVVGTPPPKKDSEALRAMLRDEPFFLELAAHKQGQIEDIVITAPEVRLKLWFLLQDMLADMAAQAGVRFVPVVPAVQDSDGFLRPEFWAPDVNPCQCSLWGDHDPGGC